MTKTEWWEGKAMNLLCCSYFQVCTVTYFTSPWTFASVKRILYKRHYVYCTSSIYRHASAFEVVVSYNNLCNITRISCEISVRQVYRHASALEIVISYNNLCNITRISCEISLAFTAIHRHDRSYRPYIMNL